MSFSRSGLVLSVYCMRCGRGGNRKGFVELPIPIGFLASNGPLFVKIDGDTLKLGLRVEMRHCNPMQICHGGMLATFIDMLMPFSI
eukprot:gene10774-13803_t